MLPFFYDNDYYSCVEVLELIVNSISTDLVEGSSHQWILLIDFKLNYNTYTQYMCNSNIIGCCLMHADQNECVAL